MELRLSIKETIIVKPLQLFKRQTIELSGLDRISPAILYTVFFYKSNDLTVNDELFTQGDIDRDDHVERAKKALQKVLIPWYPAAGRFRINEGSGKLEIDCNNQGVVFVSAVADSKLEELGRLHEYKTCYENLVPVLFPEASDVSENPIAVIQITRFACGGIAIGFGGSHALFDGIGAFNFLSSWAHISSGKDEYSETMQPNHSRDALLSAIHSPNSSHTAAASIYEQDHITAIQDLYGIPMQAMASDDRCWETALAKFRQVDDPQGGVLELVNLAMAKETIETWKRLAIERGKLSKCSTFDVLCAHVWKNNLYMKPSAKSNKQNEITDEYIKLYVRALEASDKFFPSMRELTIVADWTRFPFHALDFGWGKVSDAAILSTPVPETAFLMLNLEEPAGGFLVRIGIGRQYLHDLISNFNNLNYI
ncbi:Transferase [Corchorus capsularis]|uniref:Transferase n=1 Tax=Corchorus capsularis TaxID=210143 RepID=A0A1R3GRU6_COCAP|nr:Transferase [Corchorus capsularis]